MITDRLQIYPAEFHPDSDVDYGRNWGDAEDGTKGWLNADEVITDSVWVITADKEEVPTLIESPTGKGIAADGKSTAIYLTGGTVLVDYKLSNSIITLDGLGVVRKETRTGVIRCRNK